MYNKNIFKIFIPSRTTVGYNTCAMYFFETEMWMKASFHDAGNCWKHCYQPSFIIFDPSPFQATRSVERKLKCKINIQVRIEGITRLPVHVIIYPTRILSKVLV